MLYSSLLLKKNLYLGLINEKVDDLLLKTRAQLKVGLLVEFYKLHLINNLQFWNNDYIKVSKKHRSNVVDVLVKDIFQYNFTGFVYDIQRWP